MTGENREFRDHNAVPILGVPDIVIVETVHVDIRLAVRVQVHVRHEEMCDKSSVPPSIENSQD